MYKHKLELTIDDLVEVCTNIGLEEMELDRICQLWNQAKEAVKADMEELVKTEPTTQNRKITNHESGYGACDCLVGYDPVQELAFVSERYGSSARLVPLSKFITRRYEIGDARMREGPADQFLSEDDLGF